MSSMLTIEDTQLDEIIHEAVGNATKVVLTCRRPDGWAAFKAALVPDPLRERRILVTSQDPELTSRDPAIEPGQRVGVSFRRGHRKCIFTTVVESHTKPPGQTGDCAVLRWPQTIQQMQRRVYHRASPPPNMCVRVAVIAGHVDESCDASRQAPIMEGVLEDLSVGGIRVLSDQDPLLADCAAVVCRFAVGQGKKPFALNAIFRHREDRDIGYSLGFQFVGLESRNDGPDVLTHLARIVTNFQRAAGRSRHRHSQRRAPD